MRYGIIGCDGPPMELYFLGSVISYKDALVSPKPSRTCGEIPTTQELPWSLPSIKSHHFQMQLIPMLYTIATRSFLWPLFTTLSLHISFRFAVLF
jgi:hypothetical protein